MRRYCEWTLVVAVLMIGVGSVNAQSSNTEEEPDIVANPEDLVETDETVVERLSGAGIIDEAMIARLREMTLTDLITEARRLLDEENLHEAAPYVAVARERDEELQRRNLVPGQSVKESIEVSVLLGELALLNGEIQPAREKLLKAYRANRNDYYAASALGRLYLLTRRYRQAVNYLEKAEQIAPQDQVARARRLLAEAYFGVRYIIKARDMAQRAVDVAPDDYDALRVYASVLITIGDLDNALRQIDELERVASQAVAAKPGDLEALQRLIQARNVRQQALRENLAQLVVVGPDGVPTDEIVPGQKELAANITEQMVNLLIKQTNDDRLVKLFEIVQVSEQALKYVPDSSRHWYNHGLLLLYTQQYDPAYKAFEKALELDPSNSEAREELNRLKAASGVPTEAAPAPDQPAETNALTAPPAVSATSSIQN